MKKSKLILSVMSLCFAMAMLTYGIFAATSVSYSIRGKVSYTVTDAYVGYNCVQKNFSTRGNIASTSKHSS